MGAIAPDRQEVTQVESFDEVIREAEKDGLFDGEAEDYAPDKLGGEASDEVSECAT